MTPASASGTSRAPPRGAMFPARSLLRRWLPRPVLIELARLRRLPSWLVETPRIARGRASPQDHECGAFVLAAHVTPLRRGGTYDERLQRGKERNVELAAARLDGLLIRPGEIFSYHHAVGRPSRWRGFQPGLELHDGAPSVGIGGGACAVSNMLYLLALRAGMRIVERHRHALDLFPDDARTVPFGCGATVFYNLADLRFENPWPDPVVLRLSVADGTLRGTLAAPRDFGFRVEVYETGHRFFRAADGDDGALFRENRIRRRITTVGGAVVSDAEVAHNRGRVLYAPPAEVTVEEAA
ncbi:MAG TPA: VanW family protein [Polyangia bacterium]